MKIGTTLLGAIAALTLVTLPACDDKKDADKKTTETKTETKDGKTKTETKTTEVKNEPAKQEAQPADAGGGGAEKIGIAECDEYIEKYSKCINDKMPEASRAQMKTAMDQSVKAWKEAAAGPGKEGLATACKSALDAAKQATSSMGCEW